MNEFSWSIEARSVIHRFHSVDFVIYVEGQDDIPFWDVVFSKFTKKRFKIEKLGDKNTLLQYLRGKKDKDTYLIAMDSDFDRYHGVLNTNHSVLTYGYSIENTVISMELVRSLIATISRKQLAEIDNIIIDQWFHSFERISQPLLAAELANKSDRITVDQITPDKAARFIRNNNDFLDEKMIENHLVQLGFDYKKTIEDFNLDGLKIYEMIKGHFLSSAALSFIRAQVNKLSGSNKSISNEAFYSTCIAEFKSTFNESHKHYSYYMDVIDKHLDTLVFD